MAEKKMRVADTARKRKRLVLTCESGAPAIDVVDELFAEAFSKREQHQQEQEINNPLTSKVVPTTTNPSQLLPTSSQSYQDLVVVSTQKLGVVSTTLDQQNTNKSESLKTLFKTKTDDDEAFGEMIAKFSAAAKKLTGRKSPAHEREEWGKLADLIILELEIAARRAGNISSVRRF